MVSMASCRQSFASVSAGGMYPLGSGGPMLTRFICFQTLSARYTCQLACQTRSMSGITASLRWACSQVWGCVAALRGACSKTGQSARP